jgi:hypothetical protein
MFDNCFCSVAFSGELSVRNFIEKSNRPLPKNLSELLADISDAMRAVEKDEIMHFRNEENDRIVQYLEDKGLSVCYYTTKLNYFFYY